jgi:hypothetical protein
LAYLRQPFTTPFLAGKEFVPEYHGITVTVAKGSQDRDNDLSYVKKLGTARRISAIKGRVT